MKIALVEEVKPVKKKYPFLGISKNNKCIVLFSESSVGVCVHAGHAGRSWVGEYSETWIMDAFDAYNGVVRMEND